MNAKKYVLKIWIEDNPRTPEALLPSHEIEAEILQAIRERVLRLEQVAYEPIVVCDGLAITDYDLQEEK